jgi:uncharacterized protein YdhG (YjbR/CyaY superfamily)
MKKPQDVDEYISSFPTQTQRALKQIRATIRKAAPQAEEVISYGIPAFKQNGIIVYFAAHSKHIGLYPKHLGTATLKKELSKYKGGKGTIQFPLDKPLPLGLITRIVKLRARQNAQKAKTKKKLRA